MKIAIALCMVLAAAQAVSFFEVVVEEWEVWKLMHGKSNSYNLNLNIDCLDRGL